MTAVAAPPTFPQISRPAWGTINGSTPMNSDDVRGMFMPRKTLPRSNSSSSVSSSGSGTSVATNGSQSNGTSLSSTSDLSQWSGSNATRKRPQPKSSWPQQAKGDAQQDFSRLPQSRSNGNGMVTPHGAMQPGSTSGLAPAPGQPQLQPSMMRPMAPEQQFPPGQPMLQLLSLNGTFERKTIAVPFAPDCIRIGRQTNQKTVPTATNGFFDSKVLSRQHAEIYAERNGKIYIRDVKSSNGTFVNGARLSQENRESDPHELQTADHLELGIDIVSEDQKTVVHHKVAAKVEHAGFLNTSNNVLDMNFGDLDPANNSMMIPTGAMQMRGRSGSNASMGNNGRGLVGANGAAQVNGMAQQRPFFLTPIATDQILKRLANEMRNARLQAQDLGRTSDFVNTLLSKNQDIKDLEQPGPPGAPEPPKSQPHVNGGGGVQYRADPKARFSDPPAPPPQQPLPEKPDVPSLRRGHTERPRSGPPNASPVRQENMSQILHLTEALNSAKRDMDIQTLRMRELEMMLQKEREARELAEELAKKLEESATSPPADVVADVSGEEAPLDLSQIKEATEQMTRRISLDLSHADKLAQETAAALQLRIDLMDEQMRELREQMEEWKRRCEIAETERDADRKSLADMVVQLREEEARRIALQERRRSRSRGARHAQPADLETGTEEQGEDGEDVLTRLPCESSGPTPADTKANGTSPLSGLGLGDELAVSRPGAVTRRASQRSNTLQGQRLQAGLPYASMISVVLIGMGLMAYMNGWQSPPTRIER